MIPSNRPLYLDDHEPPVPPRARGGRSGLWVLLVVILAAGVGVALGWRQIAPLLGLGETEDPAAPLLEEGDRALAGDQEEAYDRALGVYTQALAHGDNDPRVLTRISRANALWAQARSFDAADLDARASEDAANHGRAEEIRAQVASRAQTALQRAEDAVRHGSGDADAEVALADALRLTGDLRRARSHLERALTLRREATAETLRVQALLDAADANGDLSAARARATDAIGEDPAMIRARLLLARALLAAREVGEARQQVEAVLRRSPQHGAALALRAAIDEGRPPAPPTVDVPDGGTAPDAGVPAQQAPQAQNTTPNETGDRPPREGQEASPGVVPAGRDYSWYIRNGDERLDRGDAAGARGFYEAARELRPSGSEALTGLGYVSLETGDANGAAARFRQAAQQGYAEAYIGLGSAYRRMGQLQNALTAFERYLERLPTGPRASLARRNADEIRAQLGSGGGETPPPENPPEQAPETDPNALPPPREQEGPPPEDTPAIGNEP
jgi:tetratricopeptide (TPR) repeat protein